MFKHTTNHLKSLQIQIKHYNTCFNMLDDGSTQWVMPWEVHPIRTDAVWERKMIQLKCIRETMDRPKNQFMYIETLELGESIPTTNSHRLL